GGGQGKTRARQLPGPFATPMKRGNARSFSIAATATALMPSSRALRGGRDEQAVEVDVGSLAEPAAELGPRRLVSGDLVVDLAWRVEHLRDLVGPAVDPAEHEVISLDV